MGGAPKLRRKVEGNYDSENAVNTRARYRQPAQNITPVAEEIIKLTMRVVHPLIMFQMSVQFDGCMTLTREENANVGYTVLTNQLLSRFHRQRISLYTNPTYFWLDHWW